MMLMLLEALGALALLIFMVWWTMFSGRRQGERARHQESEGEGAAAAHQDDPPA